MIGTLAVHGWAVTFGTAMMGLGGLWPPSPILAVPNVTAQPSAATVLTSYYSMWAMWHYNYLCFGLQPPKLKSYSEEMYCT